MAKKQEKKLGIIIAIIAGVVALVVSAVALVLVLQKNPDGGETGKTDGETSVDKSDTVVAYERNESGAVIRLTYYAKGDKVYKQTARNVIPYEALGVNSKEEAKELLEEIMDSTREIKGYEDVFEYQDDAVIETVSIDYNVVNLDEVKDLIGAYFEGDVENGISLSKSAKWLEEAGFSKVEP